MALHACYWLHKAISIKFIAIRRRSKVRFQPTISCFRCVNMYIFISEWKTSVVHTWIFLNKKNSSISSAWWALLPGREGERKQRARWEILHISSVVTVLFSSTSIFYFANGTCFLSLCANKSSIRQRKNKPKEPNSYRTMGISPRQRPQK